MLLLFLPEALSEEVIRALCWTFIHSLWQGLLVAGAAGLILISTRKSAASLRYNLLCALLFLFVLGTIFTFVTVWSSTDEATPTGSNIPEIKTSTEAPVSGTAVFRPQLQEHPVQVFKSYFDQNAPAVVLIWSLFFFYHFIRLLAGLNYVHRIRRTAVEEPSELWKEHLHCLGRQLGINQGIELLQSGLVQVPAVVGLFKPLILVPAGLLTNLPPACVEAILLHELAHIRRKDFAVNLLQSAVEMIFFFNPATMWLSSLIREEREACCDDIVLAVTGDKQAYLQALVSFQEAEVTSTPYAMALRSRKAHLLNRVRRMLTQENNRLSIMEKTILFSGLMAFSALAFIPKQEPVPVAAPTAETIRATPLPAPTRTEVIVTRAAPAPKATTALPVTPSKATNIKMASADTVPSRKAGKDLPAGTYEIRSVTTNVEDENGRKRAETIAVLKDGSVYRLVQIDDNTTEMSLNGQPIAKEQWDQHMGLWDDIKQKRKEAEERRAQAEKKRLEVKKQRDAQIETRRKEQEARLELTRQKRQEMEARRAQAAEARARTEVRGRHITQATTAVGTGSGREVEVIINELMSQKVISARDPLSFTLTEEELIVNGKKEDDAIRQRLKERLRVDAGDSFQYKRNGNSVTTTIVRN